MEHNLHHRNSMCATYDVNQAAMEILIQNFVH